MNSKEKCRYREEMNAVYKYLRANQSELREAGTNFYMLYDTSDGIVALGSGNEKSYAAMLVIHATAAYYDLYKEKGLTFDEYFEMLKEHVTKLLPAMDTIRNHAGEEE